MTSLDLTTSNNFIKDAVIDHVLKDLEIKLTDLAKLDQHAMDLFEYNNDNEPMWINTLGIFIGCLLGILFGKLLTNKH